MIIYNPNNEDILKERIISAEDMLKRIPAKHCFITGSFLYKKKYKDIDIFVISRTRKKIKFQNRKIKVTIIDFNDLYSLFYYSISKSCISKGILPKRPLKTTLSDYWHVINEAIPIIINEKNKYHKNIRFLVLYTEYFKTGRILDSFQLNDKIEEFKSYKEVLEYLIREVPLAIQERASISYLKRFFYTQAGYYKELLEYRAQKLLYGLVHEILRRKMHG